MKLNALCVLSNARVRSLNPESALCLLSPCFTDINDESTANDVTNEERANLYYHDGKISRYNIYHINCACCVSNTIYMYNGKCSKELNLVTNFNIRYSQFKFR